MEEEYLGVVQDPRTDDKKNLDYKHSDLAGAVFTTWKEKEPSEWKKYTPRYQIGSLSCVGQSCAKAFEILGYGVESAHPIYRSRSNYPSGGMWQADAGNICRNLGTTKESLDPSQNLGEIAMNLACDAVRTSKIESYVFVNSKDIEQVAQAIETWGHCILTFHANSNEWKAVPEYNGKDINFGHAVVAVDYFLYKDKKALLIEDSARNSTTLDKIQQRIITEDYLGARCSSAMYFTPKPVVPSFAFTKTLKFGSVGHDVKMLQIRLKIGADGIFGNKTKNAVVAFQKANNLVPDGVCGKLTNAVLNKVV